jgi:diacylglycerol kinase (ATP)
MEMTPPETNEFKGKTGAKRVWNAMFYSIAGFRAAFKHEDAFRQEVILACVLVPAAFFVSTDPIARALMIGSMLLVLLVELVNSAIEATVDRISLENHSLAKRAKDIGSAAVFVSLVNLAMVWGLIIFG